ncbi:MAG: hypothetical protein AUH86_14520 [Acidobacteria bacterium 13_1_40CM_4_58_4]|nr:MAG: hypothetical protein AUH86_14520 [Acidobacteria bacterium 13_1_40CM_4_58_4]
MAEASAAVTGRAEPLWPEARTIERKKEKAQTEIRICYATSEEIITNKDVSHADEVALKKAREGTSTAELRTQSSTFVGAGSGPHGRVKIWRFERTSREDKSSARMRRAEPSIFAQLNGGSIFLRQA